jgi:hypothetical protein
MNTQWFLLAFLLLSLMITYRAEMALSPAAVRR